MRAYSTIPVTVAILGVLLSGVAGNATGVLLDQSFVPQNPNVIAGIRGDLGEFAQTFQVGIDGVLWRVDVLVANEQLGVPTGNLYFDVRPTINGIPIEDNTALLASGTVPISILPPRPMPVLISFDVDSFGVSVAVGDVLAFVLRSDPGTDVGWYGLLGNSYPFGVPFGRGGSSEWQRSNLLDLGFQTFVEPIPEPSTLILFSIGTLGLIGHHRRWWKRRVEG